MFVILLMLALPALYESAVQSLVSKRKAFETGMAYEYSYNSSTVLYDNMKLNISGEVSNPTPLSGGVQSPTS